MNRPVMKIVSLILSTEQETGDTHVAAFLLNTTWAPLNQTLLYLLTNRQHDLQNEYVVFSKL